MSDAQAVLEGEPSLEAPARPAPREPLPAPTHPPAHWNETERAFRDVSIVDLIDEAVARHPDRVALVDPDGGTVSYRELQAYSEGLAARLRSSGLGRGSFVGVYARRTSEAVMAFVGVMRSGAAYVPLDPDSPRTRVAAMVDQVGLRTILVGPSLDAEAAALAEASAVEETIALPGRGEGFAAAEPQTAGRPDPADLAYVIFTSGSTGIPKGVMVQHRSVANLIDWLNAVYAVTEADTVLFVTSFWFDLSVYDMFGVLAAGGRVRIAGEADIQDPTRVLEIMEDEDITIWDSAPAQLVMTAPFFDLQEPKGRDTLRLVLLSGDWVPLSLPGQVVRSFPRSRVVALGGATECTVWSNHYAVGEIDPRWVSIPYGKPMQNARYYVLDGDLSPCRIGEPGDLFIAGTCVSAGYAASPALTASKYLPDAFGPTPGERMYWTGDRARWQADGTLEFLGRVDDQVKVRGYRIELGEVRSALARAPGVDSATVVYRPDATGGSILAFYCSETAAPEDVDASLAQALPAYALPSHTVRVDTMPLTSSGKIDREKLMSTFSVFGGGA